MDASDVMQRTWELIGYLEAMLGQHFPPRNERQEFLDRAALEFFHLNRSPALAYSHAERMWEERERRREQPSERELVVRFLNRLGPEYRVVADAIKAGQHREVPEDPVGEKFSG